MRIQRVQINNKINHVFDYDINSEHVEKFIINAPTSEKISILKFHKGSDGSFIIDSDKGKEKYSLNSEEAVKLKRLKSNKDDIPSYSITVKFEQFVNNQTVTRNNNETIFNRSRRTQPEENINNLPPLSIIENEAAIEWSDREKSSIVFAALILPVRPLMLSVEFQLPYSGTFGNGGVKTKKIELYIAPKDMIYDVILDFGSEATQMACYSRGATASIAGFVPLFSNIRQRYQEDSEKTIRDEDFYQNDISDDRFYRSYFMLKNQVPNEELGQILDNINHDGGRDFFKTLTSKKFVEDNKSKYIVTPNVKISCFGGQEMPKIKINNTLTSINLLGNRDSHLLYRLGILPFLYEAINEVVKDANAHFISFHILMPNVYLQVDISKILQLLQEDIKQLMSSNNVIKGFDVTAVSESDASIIGACELMRSQNANDQLPVGRYLLLDAGKGTLDLSLIEYKYDKKDCCYSYSNLWRSGIIGAGNSLSYAFMFELVHQYLENNAQLKSGVKESDVVSFVKNNILNVTTDGSSVKADPYYLLHLMRLVDSFKIFHKDVLDINKDDNNKDDNNKLPIKDLTLAGFTGWLEKQIDENAKSVKLKIDESRYVKKMIDALVTEVMNSINDMRVIFNDDKEAVDFVVFCGRAFKLSAFKIEMFNALHKRFKKIEEKTFIRDNLASSMKNICLLCSQPLVNGNYSRKINSSVKLIDVKPQQRQDNTNDNESIKGKGWFNVIPRGIRNSLFRRAEKNNSDNGEIDFKNINETTVPIFNILPIVGGVFNNSELFARDADPNAITGNSDERQGYGLKIENPESALINIGGVRFPFSSTNVQLGADKKVDVLFNGEYHILRSARGTTELKRQDINMTISPFMISSLFPNCTVTREADFSIPKIESLWNAEHKDRNENPVSESSQDSDNRKKATVASNIRDDQSSNDAGTKLDNLLNN